MDFRSFASVSLSLMLIAAPGAPGAAHAGENDICQGRTVEALTTELMNTLQTRIVRVLVTLKATGQDRTATDRETSGVAEALRRAGAYMVEPIGGQSLLVVEIDRDR